MQELDGKMYQKVKTKAKDVKNAMYFCKAIKKNEADEGSFLIGA